MLFVLITGWFNSRASHPSELQQYYQNVWENIIDEELDEQNMDLFLEIVMENGKWPVS